MLALARTRHSVLPIARSTVGVSHGHDHEPRWLDAIDNAVRKAMKQEATCLMLVRWPSARRALNRGRGCVELRRESRRRGRAALCVPPGSFFGFVQGVVEVLKPAGHDQQPRESGDGPRTRAPFSLSQHRAAPTDDESRPTMPLRPPRRSLGQGFGSTLQPAQHVPRAGDEAPRRVTAWDSYVKNSMQPLWTRSLDLEEIEEAFRTADAEMAREIG